MKHTDLAFLHSLGQKRTLHRLRHSNPNCSEIRMSEHISHGEYVDSTRRQVVETAQAMLDGRLSFLVGSQRLAALRDEVDVAGNDADFTTFVGIDSCTDALPLGEVRKYWSQER